MQILESFHGDLFEKFVSQGPTGALGAYLSSWLGSRNDTQA